ncbi:hypothetical protein [Priestia aryabhattai]|uniref:hypothetical protein n=1 Tax=Priestia aryabhattai TaxID=412384 RepID=UPI000C08A944|nr:hypothetical protein [Priestia aryabhattai]
MNRTVLEKIDPQSMRDYLREHIDDGINFNINDYFLEDIFDNAIITLAENARVGWFVIYDYNVCLSTLEENGISADTFNGTHANPPKNVLFLEEVQ